jgi:hypothetical protein
LSADLKLTGFGGSTADESLENKRKLLENEGVIFKSLKNGAPLKDAKIDPASLHEF